jgi:hypothetical protein
MLWWRRSRLVHAVVIILLLWTAADLANSSLCALDNEGMGSFPIDAATTLTADSGENVPPQVPQPHIDDCFCCSHCVDVQVVSPSLVALPAILESRPLVLATPRIFGSPLYHPPLA